MPESRKDLGDEQKQSNKNKKEVGKDDTKSINVP